MLNTQSSTNFSPEKLQRSRPEGHPSDLKEIFSSIFTGNSHANFKAVFWDGSSLRFGSGQDFTIHFKTKEALKSLFADVSMGFGEGYMNGDIEVEGDLRQVTLLAYQTQPLQAVTMRVLYNLAMLHLKQRNTLRRDKTHIASHYDIGDDFYRLWLDRKMIYSCAYFKNETDSLEQAQEEKIKLCCRKLRLHERENLLDIGCGWGGLLLAAAEKFGIRGTGITLSRNQEKCGNARIRKRGLQDRLKIEYLDYRDLEKLGQRFDKIVSIGMFEHVGKKNINDFFATARQVLKPRGLFLLHTIGKVVEEPTNTWIKKYIFPGCHIPDLASICKGALQNGLIFIDCEDLRVHYGRTLDEWLTRFEEHSTEVRRMFDERFVRMWRFYLAGCSSSFWHGKMHIFQLLFSAGTRNDLPLTRSWMSEED
ncbi:MAG: cyclopropane-fatty-acyl-phospholipid synthase family protein [Desulfobulbaceae bacterium]|nr:cyclopropane-fatty-acyl-phospholipid synthase family protein [Desulfobulbaceae bacterium]